MRVHRILNQRLAMTLCCTANSASRLTSIVSASGSGVVGAPSSDVGAKPPTNAIA